MTSVTFGLVSASQTAVRAAASEWTGSMHARSGPARAAHGDDAGAPTDADVLAARWEGEMPSGPQGHAVPTEFGAGRAPQALLVDTRARALTLVRAQG